MSLRPEGKDGLDPLYSGPYIGLERESTALLAKEATVLRLRRVESVFQGIYASKEDKEGTTPGMAIT